MLSWIDLPSHAAGSFGFVALEGEDENLSVGRSHGCQRIGHWPFTAAASSVAGPAAIVNGSASAAAGKSASAIANRVETPDRILFRMTLPRATPVPTLF